MISRVPILADEQIRLAVFDALSKFIQCAEIFDASRSPRFQSLISKDIAWAKPSGVSLFAIVPDSCDAYQCTVLWPGLGLATMEHPQQTASADTK